MDFRREKSRQQSLESHLSPQSPKIGATALGDVSQPCFQGSAERVRCVVGTNHARGSS